MVTNFKNLKTVLLTTLVDNIYVIIIELIIHKNKFKRLFSIFLDIPKKEPTKNMWRRYIDKVFLPTLLKKHFLQVIKFIKVNIIKNPKKYNDILIISPSLIGYLRFTKGLSNHKNSAGIKFDIEKNMDNKSVNTSNNKNGIWFLFLILYIKFSSKKYPAKNMAKM